MGALSSVLKHFSWFLLLLFVLLPYPHALD